MATMLSSRYSAERCMNFSRRHQRLVKQVVNDSELAGGIQKPIDKVSAKQADYEQKVEEHENAYDDMVLADRYIDDNIRSLYADCKKYDRDNPVDRILIKVFPDETYGDIIRLPFMKEINEVSNIQLRVESLGKGHAIYSYVEKIQEVISNAKKAIEENANAIRQEKLAEAEIDIAKEELIRQYEINYLDARRKYGRNLAENLFPKVRSRSLSVELDEEE